MHRYSSLIKRRGDAKRPTSYDGIPVVNEWEDQPITPPGNISGSPLDYVTFAADGRCYFGPPPGGALDTSGWIIRARDAWMDAKIQGDEEPTARLFQHTWRATYGPWETVAPNNQPARTGIMNGSSGSVETVGNISANRGMIFDVVCCGVWYHSSNLPYVRVRMPGSYSVVLWQNSPPTLERMSGTERSVVKRLGEEACDLREGIYRVTMRRINGYLVVGIGNEWWWHAEFASNSLRTNSTGALQSVSWPAGKCSIDAYGTMVVVSTAMVKMAVPNNDNLPYGSGFDSQFEGNVTAAATTLYPLGNRPDGTLLTITPTAPAGRTVGYRVGMTSNTEGIDTPFLTGVMGRRPASWTSAVSGTMDVRPAVTGMSIQSAMPPLMAGAEATIELDRNILDRTRAGWGNYVNDRAPVQIYARWRYDDNTVSAWQYLFQGYVTGFSIGYQSVNGKTISVKLRDPVFRLQGENARIDGRYAPLDYHYITSSAGRLYGWECVRELLRQALGDTAAASLLTYFPSGHYPILDSTGNAAGLAVAQAAAASFAGSPASLPTFQFPPPWGDDVLSWINKVAEHDRAVFLYATPVGGVTAGWPVPIYGRAPQIVAGRSVTHAITDAEYVEGEVNKLLTSAQNETRNNANINRVLTWGAVPHGMEAFMPALQQGEARLPSSDYNAAESSWERTLIVKHDNFSIPGGAQSHANALIHELVGRRAFFPQVDVRGDGGYEWGNLATFQLADAGVGLNGITFRIERVSHQIRIGDLCEWTTNLQVRRRSNSGY